MYENLTFTRSISVQNINIWGPDVWLVGLSGEYQPNEVVENEIDLN